METEAREVKCCPLAEKWVDGHRIKDVTGVPGAMLPIDTGASVYLGGAWHIVWLWFLHTIQGWGKAGWGTRGLPCGPVLRELTE